MNLFQLGDFTLASGRKSAWKIDCDALSDDDINTLASLINNIVDPFCWVGGVPRGGLRLAEAMKQYATPNAANNYLIVDDVFTTGKSVMKWKNALCFHPEANVQGAVIFARGPVFHWVRALFTMPRIFWVNND